MESVASSVRGDHSFETGGGPLYTTSLLGVLACMLALLNASCLARHRHAKESSRGSQGRPPATKQIIEAIRTSDAQPRRYDPRQRRLYRLKKATCRRAHDADTSRRGGAVSSELSRASRGKRTMTGAGKLGFLGRLLLLLVLLATAGAAPCGDSGLAGHQQPLVNGYNMLWSAEKRQEEVAKEARAKGRTWFGNDRDSDSQA